MVFCKHEIEVYNLLFEFKIIVLSKSVLKIKLQTYSLYYHYFSFSVPLLRDRKCGTKDLDMHPNFHHNVGHEASQNFKNQEPYHYTFPFSKCNILAKSMPFWFLSSKVNRKKRNLYQAFIPGQWNNKYFDLITFFF